MIEIAYLKTGSGISILDDDDITTNVLKYHEELVKSRSPELETSKEIKGQVIRWV